MSSDKEVKSKVKTKTAKSSNSLQQDLTKNANGIDSLLVDETDFGNGIDSILADGSDVAHNDEGWSNDDDRRLVGNIKQLVKQNDGVNYKTRLAQINWNDLAFKNHTANGCQKRFQELLKHVRCHRNLEEIVKDVETNLKAPLSSYQIFVKEQIINAKSSDDFNETMKNLPTLYDSLPPEERAIYDQKAKDFEAEFVSCPNVSKIMTATVAKNTEKLKTPVVLFSDDAISKGIESNKLKLRQMYAKLSVDEKYKWITEAISLSPSVHFAKLLNKDEQRIYNRKPKQISARHFYWKEMYNKLKDEYKDYDSKQLFSEISKRWTSLNENERKPYEEAAKVERSIIEEEQRAFNERHHLPSPKPRKRKSSRTIEASVDKTDTEELELEDNSVISPKKLKTDELSPKKKKVAQPTVTSTPLTSIKHTGIDSLLVARADDSIRDRIENDSNSSTTLTSGEKSKHKKSKKKPSPPREKPPSTLFEYFMKNVHTGKPKKAEKAFNKLEKKERKQIKAEYKHHIEKYEAKLTAYLGSLSKEQADAYMANVKAEEVGDDGSLVKAII